MQNLEIEETRYTPRIVLDPQSATISISGKSYPENTFEFYRPVMEWMELYFKEEQKQTTTVNIELVYFNSSSSKLLFDFFDLLDEKSPQNKTVVNWIYDTENENAYEAGTDFQEEFTSLDINLVEKTLTNEN